MKHVIITKVGGRHKTIFYLAVSALWEASTYLCLLFMHGVVVCEIMNGNHNRNNMDVYACQLRFILLRNTHEKHNLKC